MPRELISCSSPRYTALTCTVCQYTLFISALFYFFFVFFFFFFNDTATTEIYTLSLHDALPIWVRKNLTLVQIQSHASRHCRIVVSLENACFTSCLRSEEHTSELQSQSTISYAVFCLKKKKKKKTDKNNDV